MRNDAYYIRKVAKYIPKEIERLVTEQGSEDSAFLFTIGLYNEKESVDKLIRKLLGEFIKEDTPKGYSYIPKYRSIEYREDLFGVGSLMVRLTEEYSEWLVEHLI